MSLNLCIENIKYDERGLICAVAQDAVSGEVLMQAYMNAEALALTVQTGYAHYYSRSRKRLWKKGETSGHVQRVVSAAFDCDRDCLLLQVGQTGAACHTGNYSCFFESDGAAGAGLPFLGELSRVIRSRKEHPEAGSYTAFLFEKGVDKIAKKVGEEGVEVALAAKNENREEFLGECADLLYHLSVLLELRGDTFYDVCSVLKVRHDK